MTKPKPRKLKRGDVVGVIKDRDLADGLRLLHEASRPLWKLVAKTIPLDLENIVYAVDHKTGEVKFVMMRSDLEATLKIPKA